MRAILAFLMLLAPAQADEFVYGFKFASQAAAITAATALGHYNATVDPQTGLPAGWAMDHVIAGMQCWRPSQDVSGTDSDGNPTTTHAYLTGYFVLIVAASAAPIAVLNNAAALQFTLNRTRFEAGQSFVTKNNIGGVISDIACSPLPAAAKQFPVGGYN